MWKDRITTKLLVRSSEVSKLSSNVVFVDSKPIYLPLHIFSKKARSLKHCTKTGPAALNQPTYLCLTDTVNVIVKRGGQGINFSHLDYFSAFGSVVRILTHFYPESCQQS